MSPLLFLFLAMASLGMGWEIRLITPPRFAGLLRLQIVNNRDESRNLLTYGTPLDFSETNHFFSDVFDVNCINGAAQYTGILAKRIVTKQAFRRFEPRQVVDVLVNLTQNYALPVGPCFVGVRSTFRSHTMNLDLLAYRKFENLVPEKVKSSIIAINVLVASPKLNRKRHHGLAGSGPKTNCSSTQADLIDAAQNDALILSQYATRYLQEPCGGGFVRWYSPCDLNDNLANVTRNWDAILDGFVTKCVDYVCEDPECGPTTYAFVYPVLPYTIYLCPMFWNAPAGTCQFDSRAGTLIHEMSHFNAVAGTDDHIYGQAGAQQLAIDDPALAITNADNYEYFAEDCWGAGL